MSFDEIHEARSVFGEAIRYDLVRIDKQPKIGLAKEVIAYVTFFMINYKRNISMPIFIHELVHVWQFQQYGSVYISKSLKAQKSPEGYDYGGSENLFKIMVLGKNIQHFNFEQQADIIEDYYKKRKRQNPSNVEQNVYDYFVGMIRDGKGLNV